MKHRRRTIEERFEVARWTPTPAQIEAARERVAGMAHAYIAEGARTDALYPLVESCYLQGVLDSVAAIVAMGYHIVKKEE